MTNLKEETIDTIKQHNLDPNNIVFIGSIQSRHECTWNQFLKLADRQYDSGYGSTKVMQDLVIVFKDGQKLDRREYDGSEWWEWSMPFVHPNESKAIKSLFKDDYEIYIDRFTDLDQA
jgi:hypothetical protein